VILFVSGEYPPDVGGVGDYTRNLRSALAGQGRSSAILSRRDVRRWDARSLLKLVGAAPRTGVVHIQFQAGAFDLLGDVCLMPALLRRFRPGVRSVTTFHDTRVPYLFPRAGRLRPAAVRLLARTSHAVLAADRRDLVWLGGLATRQFNVPIGPNVLRAPPEAYDRDAYRAQLGLGVDDLAVLYFGLLNASKGLDLLLETFERVLHSRPTARLLLLGGEVGASDGTDRTTAERLRPRLWKLGDRVIRTGWLPDVRLSASLLAGDVAVLPYADGASARRGSLLACAEHGLPIVTTLPAGEEVADCVEAVSSDAAALAEAVLRVTDKPDRLRTASRVLANRTTWSRIAAAHVDIYDRLLYCRP
jgi:glycosyltransferase involved in cell wall biosynthesis